MSKVSFCYSVKTNISDKFFDDENADTEFIKWIWNTHTDLFSLKASTKPNISDVPVDSVEVTIDDLEDDTHDIILCVTADTSDSRESRDYADLIDNDTFMDLIDNKILPEFVDKFNKSCDVEFPMTKEDDFEGVDYRDGDFFVRISFSDNSNNYNISKSLKKVTFELTKEFTDEF